MPEAGRTVTATQRVAFVNVGIVQTPSYLRPAARMDGVVALEVMLDQPVGKVGAVAALRYARTTT
jgi:hypothetical protein